MCCGNRFYSRLICAMAGLILWEICAMWSVHVRFLFNTIPRKLKDLTRLIGVPFISNESLSSKLMSFLLVWKIINFVFKIFRDSLLIFSYSCISASSLLILLFSIFISSLDFGDRMWKCVIVPIRLVSSAKSHQAVIAHLYLVQMLPG